MYLKNLCNNQFTDVHEKIPCLYIVHTCIRSAPKCPICLCLLHQHCNPIRPTYRYSYRDMLYYMIIYTEQIMSMKPYAR